MDKVKVAAVIPARMASSRFPGKPLIRVRGLHMIEHVRRRALMCGRFSDVVVATCDTEIAEVVQSYGGRVLMTSPEHPGATDRVAEAIESLDCTHVANVQGDEILVLPSDLQTLVQTLQQNPEIGAWNAVARVEHVEELSDTSFVKCMVSRSGRIFFCARDFSRIPLKLETGFEPARKILGVMAYRCDFLKKYLTLPRTPLELTEAIDESRILEHDFPMQSVLFSKGYVGINVPREVSVVQSCLENDPLQKAVLAQYPQEEVSLGE